MSDTLPTVELREVWVVSNPDHCVRGLGCTRDEALAAAVNHYSESVPACFELSGTDATFASNGWYVIRIPLAIPPAAPVPPVVTLPDAGDDPFWQQMGDTAALRPERGEGNDDA